MTRLIITTGLSAAGKSTVSKMVADELSLPLVHTTKIMRKYAGSLGYTRLTPFFTDSGYRKAYAIVRPLILKEVKKRAEVGAVVDGVHDYRLYKEICDKYGRENIRVVTIGAARKYRVRRHAERRGLRIKEADEGVTSRDKIAIAGGTKKIIDDSDFKIKNEKSLKWCIREIIKHV
jgi:dephospho-CoA kinase